MNDITTLINTLGFPIAMCVGVGFYFTKILNRLLEENKLREEKFFQQLAENNQTMDKFNETLIKIDSRIESIETKIGGANNE